MTSLGTASRARTQSMIMFHINVLNFTPFFPKTKAQDSWPLLSIDQQRSERRSDTCVDSCSTVAAFGSRPVMGLLTAYPGFIIIVIVTQKPISSKGRLRLKKIYTVVRERLMSINSEISLNVKSTFLTLYQEVIAYKWVQTMIVFLGLFTFGILTSTSFHVVYCCIKLIPSVLNKPALFFWKAHYALFQTQAARLLNSLHLQISRRRCTKTNIQYV